MSIWNFELLLFIKFTISGRNEVVHTFKLSIPHSCSHFRHVLASTKSGGITENTAHISYHQTSATTEMKNPPEETEHLIPAQCHGRVSARHRKPQLSSELPRISSSSPPTAAPCFAKPSSCTHSSPPRASRWDTLPSFEKRLGLLLFQPTHQL